MLLVPGEESASPAGHSFFTFTLSYSFSSSLAMPAPRGWLPADDLNTPGVMALINRGVSGPRCPLPANDKPITASYFQHPPLHSFSTRSTIRPAASTSPRRTKLRYKLCLWKRWRVIYSHYSIGVVVKDIEAPNCLP